ncbi:MAG TPA: class I SAM-dependent methyltransferase [Gemmatimonadaceae bacterium]|jgi:2-polyprenyl-3-methyl-5-hydroxy-6-metoxy-1,4-benzoquinol methylase
MSDAATRFDRGYFDKWYRHPRHRVTSPVEIRRRASLAIGVAEFVLGRTVRSVLDVGCGEGQWRAALLKLRPRLRYQGVDASEYVVRRFGRARNIRYGTVGRLDEAGLRGPYDIVVCADVLHYLDAPELDRGLAHIGALLGGVAYLPTFTSADDVDGDVQAVRSRRPAWYLRRFAAAGLIALGLEFYASASVRETLSALELAASA